MKYGVSNEGSPADVIKKKKSIDFSKRRAFKFVTTSKKLEFGEVIMYLEKAKMFGSLNRSCRLLLP